MGQISYAGATAAVVVILVSAAAFTLPLNTARDGSPSELAIINPPAPEETRKPVNLLTLDNQTLPAQAELEDAPLNSLRGRAASDRQPRYVIDARPASYEATPVSFSF